MSRLDSFIRRLEAQRDLLNRAARDLADVDGVVFELGLGNGRTYDHLLELFPDRETYVFELRAGALDETPVAAEHIFLGEISETLPKACRRFTGRVALVHNDLGDGLAPNMRPLAEIVSQEIPSALAAGGIILSNMTLDLPTFERMPLLPGMHPDRYYIYRKPGH